MATILNGYLAWQLYSSTAMRVLSHLRSVCWPVTVYCLFICCPFLAGASLPLGPSAKCLGFYHWGIGAGTKLRMKEMDRKYDQRRTHYMTAEERAYFEVEFLGTQVRYKKPKQRWMDDGRGKDLTLSNGEYSIVQAMNGKLYAFRVETEMEENFRGSGRKLHHSSFFGDAPVWIAGGWKIINGYIAKLDNGSGHFRPNLESFELFVGRMVTAEYVFQRIDIHYLRRDPVNQETQVLRVPYESFALATRDRKRTSEKERRMAREAVINGDSGSASIDSVINYITIRGGLDKFIVEYLPTTTQFILSGRIHHLTYWTYWLKFLHKNLGLKNFADVLLALKDSHAGRQALIDVINELPETNLESLGKEGPAAVRDLYNHLLQKPDHVISPEMKQQIQQYL